MECKYHGRLLLVPETGCENNEAARKAEEENSCKTPTRNKKQKLFESKMY